MISQQFPKILISIAAILISTVAAADPVGDAGNSIRSLSTGLIIVVAVSAAIVLLVVIGLAIWLCACCGTRNKTTRRHEQTTVAYVPQPTATYYYPQPTNMAGYGQSSVGAPSHAVVKDLRDEDNVVEMGGAETPVPQHLGPDVTILSQEDNQQLGVSPSVGYVQTGISLSEYQQQQPLSPENSVEYV